MNYTSRPPGRTSATWASGLNLCACRCLGPDQRVATGEGSGGALLFARASSCPPHLLAVVLRRRSPSRQPASPGLDNQRQLGSLATAGRLGRRRDRACGFGLRSESARSDHVCWRLLPTVVTTGPALRCAAPRAPLDTAMRPCCRLRPSWARQD